MRLNSLNIRNYKSIGNITIMPSDFTVLIGPNASGKSNFANAISFLIEVYSYDLETAIRRKGGYENIALRKQKRSRNAVSFDILFKVSQDEFDERQFGSLQGLRLRKKSTNSNYYQIRHAFSFKAVRQDIKAEFRIESELIEIDFFSTENKEEKNKRVVSISRDSENIIDYSYDKSHKAGPFGDFTLLDHMIGKPAGAKGFPLNLSSQKLVASIGFINQLVGIDSFLSRWAVYQFSPNIARGAGVPTPNPELSEAGENLPALVDWLKNNQPRVWEKIMNVMRVVMPNLLEINIGYLTNKTLGLFFQEEGIGRGWTSEEVSDGTVLTLSILCSISDPRKSLILVEEPENAVHPWIMRTLIENFKEISKDKNVIITTHSPILIDMVYPSEIWCISKREGVTNLQKLVDIAPNIDEGWRDGAYKISEYLDSGLIPNVVPQG